VSVVITAFNTGRYLPDTLDSVFAQTYPTYEIIVVDDGSTDDTRSRAQAYGARITLLEREHEGLGPARNAGLARASGDFVAFLDSDDLWDPDWLRVQLDVARRHPESGLIVCDAVEFEGETVTIPHLYPPSILSRFDGTDRGEFTTWLYRDLFVGNPIGCPAQALLPRHVVDAVGTVCITPNGAQDYDYYVRIARTYPVTFHAASLARWRFRPGSMSGSREGRGLRWAANAVVVLEREERACAAADRAALRAAMVKRARDGVASACRARAERGSRPDRDDLATISRIVPRVPTVVAARLAFALPTPVDRLLLRGARSGRAMMRAMRQRGAGA
jgi:glycosyltransferase involved in cell wall biosynthesis